MNTALTTVVPPMSSNEDRLRSAVDHLERAARARLRAGSLRIASRGDHVMQRVHGLIATEMWVLVALALGVGFLVGSRRR